MGEKKQMNETARAWLAVNCSPLETTDRKEKQMGKNKDRHKLNYVWVVEIYNSAIKKYIPVAQFPSRRVARGHAGSLREESLKTRIVPYRVTIDVRGRVNRQLRGWRRDY